MLKFVFNFDILYSLLFHLESKFISKLSYVNLKSTKVNKISAEWISYLLYMYADGKFNYLSELNPNECSEIAHFSEYWETVTSVHRF